MGTDSLKNYKPAYEELELIMEHTYDQITIANEKGIIIKASKSVEKIFGMPANKIIGTSIFDLEKKQILDKSAAVEALNKKQIVTLIQETYAKKKLLVTSIPMFNEKGELIKILSVSKDITEIEALNHEVNKAKHKIKWFQEELNKRRTINEKKLLYKSKGMERLIDLIYHISSLDVTVLLLGETGTGKSFMAKLIHELSPRREHPFIQINCSAIPENLLESELFGYEEGAFTGAMKGGKKGLFEIADMGTIFLDEIGDMPIGLQSKILHVLDDKKVYRIGSYKPIKVNARLITATNKNLENAVDEGTFRKDLYYRLNVLPITIPPLRERREDIPEFIKLFLGKYNDKYGTDIKVSEKAIKLLISYDYPGNIRELENIVERLIVTTSNNIISEEDVLETLKPVIKTSYHIDEIIPIKLAVEEVERELLTLAFKKYKTTRKVAEVLEIDQSTVVKKAQKLNIKR